MALEATPTSDKMKLSGSDCDVVTSEHVQVDNTAEPYGPAGMETTSKVWL